MGLLGANNNNIASNNLSPSHGGGGVGVGAASAGATATSTTNNLINGLSSLGLQSLQNNHINRNEIQVRNMVASLVLLLHLSPPTLEYLFATFSEMEEPR